jgi:hypothetical protein
MTGSDELAAVEARLWAILDPFRGQLEANALYGVATIRRPGATAHDYFAGVKVGRDRVSFFLKPVYTHPDLVRTLSPGLRKRMQGKSCFNFARVDETLFDELARLTERSFRAYEASQKPKATRRRA